MVLEGRQEALQAYFGADYDACIAILRPQRGAERDLLLARTYLRMRHHAESEAVLRGSSAEGRSTWAALMGAARARQGDIAEAATLLERALSTACNDAELAEARYQQALLGWMDRRNDDARAILAAGHFGAQSALAEELRGHLATEAEDYAAAVRHFEAASMLAGGDLMVECNGLRNASNYAREMYMPVVMDGVMRRMERIAWTPYLEGNRFHITRAAAWFAAIQGSYDRAVRDFNAATHFNVTEPWRIYALCDRAYLSLVLGEPVNGWAMAEEALAAADGLDWESFREGEQVALLYLANLFTAQLPEEAEKCWRRYTAYSGHEALLGGWSREPHIQAWEAFTAGLLASGARNDASAAAHLNRAFSTYQRIGYRWRAVLTLLALRGVGVRRPGYDEYVEATLQRFPNSWLRDLAEREFHTSGLPLVAAA
jgi:hypothetical protein